MKTARSHGLASRMKDKKKPDKHGSSSSGSRRNYDPWQDDAPLSSSSPGLARNADTSSGRQTNTINALNTSGSGSSTSGTGRGRSRPTSTSQEHDSRVDELDEMLHDMQMDESSVSNEDAFSSASPTSSLQATPQKPSSSLATSAPSNLSSTNPSTSVGSNPSSPSLSTSSNPRLSRRISNSQRLSSNRAPGRSSRHQLLSPRTDDVSPVADDTRDLGPGIFIFDVLVTVPLSPRWVSFVFMVTFPRGGSKIIVRRYRHIQEFHQGLIDSLVYDTVPDLPPDLSSVDLPTTLDIENHRIAIQNYFNQVGSYQLMLLNPSMLVFLGQYPVHPKRMKRPTRPEFDDEDIEDKIKRDMTEWRILEEGPPALSRLNSLLLNLTSFEHLLTKMRRPSDWIYLKALMHTIAQMGELLQFFSLETRFLPKAMTISQHELMEEDYFSEIIELAYIGLSEIKSKLRRIWATLLDATTPSTTVNQMNDLSEELVSSLANPSLVVKIPGYKMEFGTADFSHKSWPSLFAKNTPWYHDYFYNRDHINLMTPQGVSPLVVSFMADKTAEGFGFFRAIIRSDKGNEKYIDSARGREMFEWSSQISVVKAVVERMDPTIKASDLVVMKEESLADELLVFESRDMRVCIRFTVSTLTSQTTEEEMFSNHEGSEDFHRFLELLGTKIELSGWNRFPGGLDIRGTNTTGTHSVFTTYSGYDIMYHVSTLLPATGEQGAQNVQKKRHIGNDILMVVFQDEGSEPYIPNCVKSQYIQVVIVVRKLARPAQPVSSLSLGSESAVPGLDDIFYEVAVIRNGDVPTFGPPLPIPAVMKHGPEFRSWILHKMVNGELSAYRSPLFVKQLREGFKSQLETLVGKFATNLPKEKSGMAEGAANVASKGFKQAGKFVGGLGKLVSGKPEKSDKH